MKEDNTNALLVGCFHELWIASISVDLPDRVVVAGEQYEAMAAQEMHGFYDWLRSSPGQVVGIRFWPISDEAQELARISPPGPYFRMTSSGKALNIFFGPERDYVEGLSGDQDFGCNRIYKRESQYVISFNDRLDLAQELNKKAVPNRFHWCECVQYGSTLSCTPRLP